MTNSAAAGVHACAVCGEPASVFRFDGDTALPMCARHLFLSDPAAEEAYARLASSPRTPDVPTFPGNDLVP